MNASNFSRFFGLEKSFSEQGIASESLSQTASKKLKGFKYFECLVEIRYMSFSMTILKINEVFWFNTHI